MLVRKTVYSVYLRIRFDKFVVESNISSIQIWYYYFLVTVKKNLQEGRIL